MKKTTTTIGLIIENMTEADKRAIEAAKPKKATTKTSKDKK